MFNSSAFNTSVFTELFIFYLTDLVSDIINFLVL